MAEDKRSLLQRFIIWREKNIKEKRFILILSFLVGIFTAFAALILKVIIHWIQNFLTDNFNATEANYLYLVYPVVGIFLTGLFVRYVVKDDISHGVTKILYAISRRQGACGPLQELHAGIADAVCGKLVHHRLAGHQGGLPGEDSGCGGGRAVVVGICQGRCGGDTDYLVAFRADVRGEE